MKKVLALAVVSALTASVAVADSGRNVFTGWSAGVHGGWASTRANPTLYLNSAIQSNTAADNFNQGFAGAHLDWTRSAPNSWLHGLGVALGSGFSSSDTDMLNPAGVKLANYNVKRQFYGELVARLGWNCHDKWALYALAAVRLQNVKVDLNLLNGTSRSTTNQIWSIAPGLGVDYKFANRFSAGLQYRYTFDQNFEWNTGANRVSSNLNSHNVLARVSYHF